MTTLSLRRDGQQATIGVVGAALLSYRVDDLPVVVAPDGADAVSEYAGSVLAPWPNRIADGAWRWDGVDLRVPINEPSRGTALHGLVYDREWTVREHTDSSAVLRVTLGDDPGYPFSMEVTAHYALEPGVLSVALAARNSGDRAAPVGLGIHPYFAVRERVDDVELTLAATEILESDERLLPLRRRPFGDFARGSKLGDRAFDNALVRDGSRRTVAVLDDGDRLVRIDAGATSRWLMLYTGDGLPAARRRRVMAIEPMTCPPNAFVTGEGLDVLAPGEVLDLSWSISVQRERRANHPSP